MGVGELAIEAMSVLESRQFHPFGRSDRDRSLFGERQIHRRVFAAKKTSRCERFEFFLFADSFEPLTDVDEGWNHRIVGAEDFGNP